MVTNYRSGAGAEIGAGTEEGTYFCLLLLSAPAPDRDNIHSIMSTNCATFDGTARYIDRFAGRAANGHFREAQGLVLSSIGIGTYLGDPDEATDTNYTSAIVRAVQLGINVIDSAANYRFQRSERSIGQALKILQAITVYSVTNL